MSRNPFNDSARYQPSSQRQPQQQPYSQAGPSSSSSHLIPSRDDGYGRRPAQSASRNPYAPSTYPSNYTNASVPPSPAQSPRKPTQGQRSNNGHGDSRQRGPPSSHGHGQEQGQGQGPSNRYMSAPGQSDSGHSSSHGHTAAGVAAGQIGSGYGPYTYQPESSIGHDSSRGGYSGAPTTESAYAAPSAHLLYNAREGPEPDDHLHNPKDKDPGWELFSLRGWLNAGMLFIITAGLVTLFAGYPILTYFRNMQADNLGAWNRGGTNATGQVPDIPGFAALIDTDTPDDAKKRVGHDGQNYELVFSDEFNQDGRSFWPGDDPFWEAVDLHYWGTGDYEWYDRDAATTKDGKLQLTITEEPIHNLSFRSGMIQSWNKMCFTGGYIEVSVSLPGTYYVPGLWPGAWTMGNLARAGFGATTDGTWPFSYNTCDIGTYRNQSDGNGPAAAMQGGGGPNGELSYQPGQRLSACTCSNAGKEHPGPSPNVGRGSPEIDILEAEIRRTNGVGVGGVSQSAQIAPYDAAYTANEAGIQVNGANTHVNSYKGGPYQQAISAVSQVASDTYYGGQAYQTYGFEYNPGTTDGFITWTQGDQPMWTLQGSAIGANAATQIGPRLISEEPMYVILNLGMSASFQEIDWGNLKFPATMFVDYVRIYQREGHSAQSMSCDGINRPTSEYIKNHLNSYTNPELTTHAQAGYQFPKNSRQDGC